MDDDVDVRPAYAVELHGLTKHYGEAVAVARVDLRIPGGRVHGLLGPNGAGKTTLLRMLLGLIRPDGGTMSLLGRDTGPACLDGVAGFVESPSFYPYLSGRRNLEMLAAYDGTGAGPRTDAAVTGALARAGLLGREERKVGTYSFGMRQRLGIAAALLREPRLLVLDEPANGLDPAGLRDMRDLIRELGDSGMTVLLSSHHMGEVETLCDSVTIMRTGHVVYDGTVEDLRAQAPAPGHRLHTGDDRQALALATTRPGIHAEEHPESGLAVRAGQQALDDYVIALAAAGVPVRSLQLVQTPLETLFTLLTEGPEPTAEAETGPARQSAENGPGAYTGAGQEPEPFPVTAGPERPMASDHPSGGTR
jgi:ABC-2 type transport system ATP-binding protein